MLQITKYTTGTIQTNVYIVWETDSMEAVIIDPGANGKKIIDILKNRLKVIPKAILLTHGHFDHIMAVKEITEEYDIPVYAGAEEKEVLGDGKKNLSESFERFSYTIGEGCFSPLKDGEAVMLLNRSFQVLHTPGHTEGSVCYYLSDGLHYKAEGEAEEKNYPVLFSGDTLFCESYGRTDFPTGSERELIRSINEKLLVLPEETAVFPGHEGQTSIGNEKRYNPAVVIGKMQ